MQLQSILNMEITNPVNRTLKYTSNNGATFMSFTLSFSLQTTLDITVEDLQSFLQDNEQNIVTADHMLTNDAFQVLLFQPQCKHINIRPKVSTIFKVITRLHTAMVSVIILIKKSCVVIVYQKEVPIAGFNIILAYLNPIELLVLAM